MRRSVVLLLAWVPVCVSGCQSIYREAGQIVGDSMTIGNHYPGLGMVTPDTVPAPIVGTPLGDLPVTSGGCPSPTPGTCSTDGLCQAPVSEMVPMMGCAGGTCDGRCGGRCRIAMERIRAQMISSQMRARDQLRNHPVWAQHLESAHRRCAGGHCGGAAGPELGAVTYPYYTTRGPRDFLLANPPSIGP